LEFEQGANTHENWPKYPPGVQFEMSSGVTVDEDGIVYPFTRDIEHWTADSLLTPAWMCKSSASVSDPTGMPARKEPMKSLSKTAAAFALRAVLASVAMLPITGEVKASEPQRVEQNQELTIAVGGDMLGPYRSFLNLRSPGFEEVKRIFSSADAGFANQEGAVFDYAEFNGPPAAENGGGTPLSPAIVASERRQMGITMVSLANNHATDWGVEGLLLTQRTLERAGLVHSGSGSSEEEARAPSFVATPKGVIALVATASTITRTSTPANPGTDYLGHPTRARPGISILRTDSAMFANTDEMRALRAMAARRGHTAVGPTVRLGAQEFQLSDHLGLTYHTNARDENAILASVRAAADRSRLTIFSIHAHETSSSRGTGESSSQVSSEPGDFLQPLFHRAIDAGASMVVRHGPHVLNGIEIYHGRPIFYSFGSLFFDYGGARSYTNRETGTTINYSDEWFETAVASVRYRDNQLVEIRIYPMTLEVSTEPTGGLPMLATGVNAERILRRIQRDSARYGTQIQIERGVGIIRGPAAY
jgi:poly-gamma-glutamate capsule biosynthesis protein CapA/YwtB (metallophosphatase superfamily)